MGGLIDRGEKKGKKRSMMSHPRERLRVMMGLKGDCRQNHSRELIETNHFRGVKLSLVFCQFKNSGMLMDATEGETQLLELHYTAGSKQHFLALVHISNTIYCLFLPWVILPNRNTSLTESKMECFLDIPRCVSARSDVQHYVCFTSEKAVCEFLPDEAMRHDSGAPWCFSFPPMTPCFPSHLPSASSCTPPPLGARLRFLMWRQPRKTKPAGLTPNSWPAALVWEQILNHN